MCYLLDIQPGPHVFVLHLLQVALLNTKLAAADSRLQRLTTELEHRPPASAAAAMAEQLVAMSALLTQQLEAEGWGQEGTAAAVAAVAVPGQLEPLLQVTANATSTMVQLHCQRELPAVNS